MRKPFIRGAILALWIVLLGILVYRQVGSKRWGSMPSEDAIILKGNLPEGRSEHWLGIYFQKTKIGSSHEVHEKLSTGEQRISSQSQMRIQTLGKDQKISTDSKVTLDPEGNLKTFQAVLKTFVSEEEIAFFVKGQVAKDRLRIQVTTAGETAERELPLREPIFLSETLRTQVVSRWETLRNGDELSFPFFDPLTMSQERMRVKIVGKEWLDTVEGKREAVKLEERFQDLLTTVWLDRVGVTLLEISPVGFEVRMESEQQAQAEIQNDNPIDILEKTSVSVTGRIPRQPMGLAFRLHGIDGVNLNLEDHRQQKTGDVLKVSVEKVSAEQSPIIPFENREDLREYVTPSLLIQSDHPKIIQMAKKIVGSERESLHVAKLLYQWVDEHVRDDFSASIPSALEVLQSRRGDCNEHTVLYVALARALGLPARINVGLVSVDQKSFMYHAWPEVYVGQWLAIDPTLHQFPADATHIRLVQGDLERQIQILQVIGRIRIEIVTKR